MSVNYNHFDSFIKHGNHLPFIDFTNKSFEQKFKDLLKEEPNKHHYNV